MTPEAGRRTRRARSNKPFQGKHDEQTRWLVYFSDFPALHAHVDLLAKFVEGDVCLVRFAEIFRYGRHRY